MVGVVVTFAVIGGVSVLLWFSLTVMGVRQNKAATREASIQQQCFEAYCHRLKADSWWFSEDEITMRLMQDLASGMSVDEARKWWRERRAKAVALVSPVPCCNSATTADI